MLRPTILAAFLGFATIGSADQLPTPLPQLFSVTKVAANDSLNIRSLPNAKASVLGTLAHNAKDIEVVDISAQGNWAMVNSNGQSGWVALGYLKKQEPEQSTTGLPSSLRCFGTEPFWSLAFSDQTVTFRDPQTQNAPETYNIVAQSPAPGFTNLTAYGVAIEWMAGQKHVKAHILPGKCSDGMSDATYALHYVDNHMSNLGCCTIAK